MQINDIKRKTENKKSVLIGRGGKRGKTAGRGTKGQKARSGRKIRPEIRDMIKRIPKMRGRGKNSNLTIQTKTSVVNLTDLSNAFSNGDVVTRAVLIKKEVIRSQKGNFSPIKILGTGELTKKITLKGFAVSASVKEKVEKAGGKIYG